MRFFKIWFYLTMFFCSGLTASGAFALERFDPDPEVIYTFIEGSKNEFMTIDPVRNVRRWTKPEKPHEYTWRVEKASSGKHKIRANRVAKQYLYVAWDGSIGVASPENKDYQEFEFQKLTAGEASLMAPELFGHVLSRNVNEPGFMDKITFVAISIPSRGNDFVSVGWDGNIVSWAKDGAGDNLSNTQVFAMKKESDFSRQRTVVERKKTIQLNATIRQVHGVESKNALLGAVEVTTHSEPIRLTPVETQKPGVALVVTTKAFHRQNNDKYLLVSLDGTRVSASEGGLMLDEPNLKGYFLEDVTTKITMLSNAFDRLDSAPKTSSYDGVATKSQGISLDANVGLSKDGPSVGGGAGFSMSTSNSTEFLNFSIKETVALDGPVSAKYYMSSVIEANAGALGGGGVQAIPYTGAFSLLKSDILGELSGQPLHSPTDMAKTSLPLHSSVSYIATADGNNGAPFTGKVKFSVKLTLNLLKVQSDGAVQVNKFIYGSEKATRVIERVFEFDFPNVDHTVKPQEVNIVPNK